MAINPDYPMLTWEQANPFQTGLMKSKELLAKQLANQYAQEQNKIAGVQARYQEPLTMQQLVADQLKNRISEIQSRYEEPKQREALEKAIQYNKYYGPNIQSEIGLRGAQASHASQEAQKIKYMLEQLKALQQAGGMGAPAGEAGMLTQEPGTTAAPGGATPGAAPMTASGQSQAGTVNPFLQAQLNKMLYGSPVSPEQKQQYEQQKANIGEYQKGIPLANEQANAAEKVDEYVDQFKEAYKKSKYKGPGTFGGNITPEGKVAGVLSTIGKDFTHEQEAQTAAQNLQAAMIPIFKGGKITNMELQFLGNLKPNLRMTPEAVETTSKYIKAAGERTKEYPRFLKTAQTRGIDKQTADILFNMYKSQRPIIDVGTKLINNEYSNTGSEYLNPEAAKAVQEGRLWEPPITDAEIKHTAKINHISEATVRKYLKSQGRL